jgi:DNA replication protein DnaC
MNKIDYSKFLIQNLSRFKSGDLICAVMNDGIPEYRPIQFTERITCPMCGSKNGYKIVNHNELWWACTEDTCISKNGRAKTYNKPKEDLDNLMQKVGVPKIFQSASFDNWNHSNPLKKELLSFLDQEKPFLVILGSNGCGKSYASVALMKEYYKKHKNIPIFYAVSEMYQQWLKEMPSPNAFTYRLTNHELLVIDDLGIRTPSDAFLDYIYLIINSRYSNLKRTIVTTNLDSKELVDKFGKTIVSRLLSGIKIHMKGLDMRYSA